MASLIQQQVRRIDANLPVFAVKTMEHQIDESIFTDRLVAALSAAFGILATVLAAVGLYGVMAFTVVRRTREIGIRMALGANPSQVLSGVLREGMTLAAIGVAIGIMGALAATRLLESLLAGVSPHDPLAFVSVSMGLALAALAANLIPARRAASVDPMHALRFE
jgi:ABC-type antimicrobial peptide transport system permease subunit